MDSNLVLTAIFVALFVVALYVVWRSRAKVQRDFDDYRRLTEGQIHTLIEDRTKANSLAETLAKQLEQERGQLDKVKSEMKSEFENLANKIFDEKSTVFRRTNSESIEALLNPFRTNINEFKEKVDRIYTEENVARGELKNQINNLLDLNRNITEETTNLTNALKGNSKVQGDWGEMILERLLEDAGLTKGVQYTVQENLKDEHGSNIRPDVVIKLPEDRNVVVDSKVSLKAYVDFSSAESSDERDTHLKKHIVSIRSHVNELHLRNYQSALNSPDFVIMFVPNEPAFVSAMQADPSLWAEAYNKKVIISTPANLYGLLRMVNHLWRTDSQNRNAMEIAEEGGRLYDKFVGFIDKFTTIGRNLESATKTYDEALGQLKTGRGNLISKAEKLKKMGVKASKSLPAQLIEMDEE